MTERRAWFRRAASSVLSAAGSLYLGNNAGDSGTYNLSGSSSLAAPNEYIGNSGIGSFTQSGGTNSTGSLVLGQAAGSTGIYNLNGGLLTLSSAGMTQGSGTASFNFGGGTLGAGAPWSSPMNLNLTGAGGNATVDTTGGSIGLSGNLSGSGGLTKVGAGMLMLTGLNTYSGGATISAGVLNINGDAAIGVANGALGFSGNGTLQAGAAVITLSSSRAISIANGITGAIDSNGNALAISGAISGGGSLAKVGAGMLALDGSNSYAGTTIVSGGTLQIGPTGSIAAVSTISVNDNSTLAVTAAANLPGNTITVSPGSLFDTTGASNFSLASGNLLTIGRPSGSGTDINGNFTLGGGTIDIGGTGTPATLTEAGGLTLGGGALKFDLSSSGQSDLFSVGNLSINAATTINLNLSGGSLATGSYNLIDYSGNLTGSLSALTLNGLPGGSSQQAFALVASASSTGVVMLQVVNAANLVWTGSQSGTWDAVALNWSNSGTAARFSANDTVTFDDTASSGAVTINSSVQPQSVLFNNNSLSYTLSGSGGIAGAASLTKSGSGMLTSSTLNTYSGNTTISP